MPRSEENKLEMIFDDENSTEGIDSGEESDLDRQLENEIEHRGEKSIKTIAKGSPSKRDAKMFTSGCLFAFDFSCSS